VGEASLPYLLRI